MKNQKYITIEFRVIIYAIVRVWSGAQELGYISTLMSIYQNSDILTKKFIALIKTIFSIVTKILIYFYNYIL